MQKRIFWSVLAIVTCAVLVVTGVIAFAIYDVSTTRTEDANRDSASFLAEAVEAGEDLSGYARLMAKDGVRLTVIDKAGEVLLDNAANPVQMDNHLTREEFAEANEKGSGSAMRDSETLGEQYRYYAVKMTDGSMLRVARSQRTVLGLLTDMRGALIAVMVIVISLSGWIAMCASRAVIKPLSRIDLDDPERNNTYAELTPLLRRIAMQKVKLDLQLKEMELRQNRVSEITRNMREGLIVLDARGVCLSVNDSARRLLGVSGDEGVGKHLFELSRDAKLEELMRAAEAGGEAEGLLLRDERAVEAHVSPVLSEDKRQGYVVLIVDVTEKRDAERMRREFTGNVTHELKTPLTSISGYAEIMQNGVAKDEDMRVFAGKIYKEAQRLIALIGDILRLSKLDEGDVSLPYETVDLNALAVEAADALASQAAARGVTVETEGEGACVRTVRQLAYETVYNLIDNAIRYNAEGGRVTVRLDGGRVEVEDTGIGIAPKYQEKVFERFFRVDKSHSKTTGGTGLGLSIVKHAAAFLGAKVRLESEEGKGTRVTVDFPA